MVLVICSVLLAIATATDRLPWRDSVNLLALMLSVAGIWIGSYQLVLAARAAHRAQEAAEITRTHMASSQQLALLHSARAVEARLERARVEGDPRLALEALADWRQVSSELSGLAGTLDEGDDLILQIRTSTISARKVSEALRRKNPDVSKYSGQALTVVTEVCDSFSERIGKMKGMKGFNS